MTKPEPLRSAIRRKVAERSLTTYRIAKDLKGAVSRKMLDLYLAGESDLTGERIDALMRYLGLRPADA